MFIKLGQWKDLPFLSALVTSSVDCLSLSNNDEDDERQKMCNEKNLTRYSRRSHSSNNRKHLTPSIEWKSEGRREREGERERTREKISPFDWQIILLEDRFEKIPGDVSWSLQIFSEVQSMLMAFQTGEGWLITNQLIGRMKRIPSHILILHISKI